MPEQGVRRRRQRGRPGGDLTLADSADARLPVARLSKSRRSTLAAAAETALDVCRQPEPGDDDDQPALETTGAGPTADTGGCRRLPAELWYLIGQHVAPQNVASFAAICRDAYRVTLTHRFWTRLWLRWCAPPQLPAPLAALTAPGWLHERRGCRAAVVRALHAQHAPLHACRRRAADSTDLAWLVGARCVSLGRAPAADHWLYCVLFRRPPAHHYRRLAPARRADVQLAREQLFYNVDAGVTALLVRAAAVSQLPAVFGHALLSAAVTVGAGSLTFTETGYREAGSRRPAEYLSRALVLVPVKSFRLVHWWDEEFRDVFERHFVTDKAALVWDGPEVS